MTRLSAILKPVRPVPNMPKGSTESPGRGTRKDKSGSKTPPKR